MSIKKSLENLLPRPIPRNGIKSKEQLGQIFVLGHGSPIKEIPKKVIDSDEKCPIDDFLSKVVVIDDDDLSQGEKNTIECFIFLWMERFTPIEVTYDVFRIWIIENLNHQEKNDPLFIEVVTIIESRFKMIDPEHAKVFKSFFV